MACIAVPEHGEGHHPAFALADLVVDSLLEVDGAALDEVARRQASEGARRCLARVRPRGEAGGKGRSRTALPATLALLAGLVLSGRGAATASEPSATAAWGATANEPCDGLDASLCMLPFPNDYYTVADPSTVTGRRVDSRPPRSRSRAAGKPSTRRRGRATTASARGRRSSRTCRGLDLAASRVATIADMGASLAPTSPIVLDRRADRHPLAHLGRARCHRPQPGDAAPRRPPGAQPDRGRSLHRGAARLEDGRRVGHRAGTGVRGGPRLVLAGRRWSRHRLRRPPALGRAAVAPRWRGHRQACSWPGTSPWPAPATSRSPRSPCATRRFAALRQGPRVLHGDEGGRRSAGTARPGPRRDAAPSTCRAT